MKPIHPHEQVWGMTASTWGYVTWAIVFFVIVLGLELLSKDILGVAPWPSISYTLKKLIADHAWIALLLLFALLTFIAHILNPGKWGV